MQLGLRELNKKDADKAEIAEFGKKLLCQFCESKTDISLNSLGYRLFHRKLKQMQQLIMSESLPPTSDATMFHSYRTYHQTQLCRGKNLDLLDWEFFIHK